MNAKRNAIREFVRNSGSRLPKIKNNKIINKHQIKEHSITIQYKIWMILSNVLRFLFAPWQSQIYYDVSHHVNRHQRYGKCNINNYYEAKYWIKRNMKDIFIYSVDININILDVMQLSTNISCSCCAHYTNETPLS